MTVTKQAVETAAAAALHERSPAPLSKTDARAHRPEVVGPDAPEDPFPIIISGAVQRGFGRGGKDLGCPTGVFDKIASNKIFSLTRGILPLANLPDESLPVISSVTQTGVYYGFAQVSSSKGDEALLSEEDTLVHPMVMSLGWNPFYKNKQLTAVSAPRRFT